MSTPQFGQSQSLDVNAMYAEAESALAGLPTSTPGAEADNTPPEPSPEAQPAQTTTPLTMADLEKALQSLNETWERRLQSTKDKRLGRIEHQLQEIASRNKSLTEAAKVAKMPAEQMANLQKNLREEALNMLLQGEPAEQPADTPQPAKPQETGQPEAVNEVNIIGQRMMIKAGLIETDPELADIVTDGTPEDFFLSITEAAAKKKARITDARAASTRAPAVGPTGAKAPARNQLQQVKFGSVDDYYALAEADFGAAVNGRNARRS